MLASGGTAVPAERGWGPWRGRVGGGARRGGRGRRRPRGRGGRGRSAGGERGATRRPSVADSLGGGDGGPYRCRAARRSRQASKHRSRRPDRRGLSHARPLGSPVVRLGAVRAPRAGSHGREAGPDGGDAPRRHAARESRGDRPPLQRDGGRRRRAAQSGLPRAGGADVRRRRQARRRESGRFRAGRERAPAGAGKRGPRARPLARRGFPESRAPRPDPVVFPGLDGGEAHRRAARRGEARAPAPAAFASRNSRRGGPRDGARPPDRVTGGRARARLALQAQSALSPPAHPARHGGADQRRARRPHLASRTPRCLRPS